MSPGRTRVRVVGIGASAGGVDAYSRLLAALPPDTGMAYVVVPHLSPTHHSELSQLLARITAMPVTEAVDGEALRPNHVHVLPSDKVMTIGQGRLRLETRPPGDVRPTVIDHFLDSLARALGPRAIGVVLSGTGADGTVGLQTIRSRGGTTYAQDFASAAYDGMPRSAVEAGAVDFTLPPEAIAQSLAELARPERPPSAEPPPADTSPQLDEAEAARSSSSPTRKPRRWNGLSRFSRRPPASISATTSAQAWRGGCIDGWKGWLSPTSARTSPFWSRATPRSPHSSTPF